MRVSIAARIFCAGIFAVLSFVITSSRAEHAPIMDHALAHDVRCVIKSDTASWKNSGPALVSIRLENLSERDLDIVIVPTLYLRNAEGTYWSPIDFTHNKALDIREQPLGNGEAVAIAPIPLNVHLGKHGSFAFEVDAAKTKWDRDISSAWPARSMSALMPGSYSLHLELSDNAGNLVKSNEIKVSLEM